MTGGPNWMTCASGLVSSSLESILLELAGAGGLSSRNSFDLAVWSWRHPDPGRR